MPVKLKVTQETQPSTEQEFLYHQDVITIGREKSNVLQLPDAVRKLVSRFHARIERNGESYHLTDLHSRNQTFLNEQPLEPDKPYPLQDGDRIRIGGYLLSFLVLLIPAAHAPDTAVDFNPFLNEANDLARVFSRLLHKYAREDQTRRSTNLRQALAESLQELPSSEVGQILQHIFTPQPQPQASEPAGASWPELLAKLQASQGEIENLRRELRLRELPSPVEPPSSELTAQLQALQEENGNLQRENRRLEHDLRTARSQERASAVMPLFAGEAPAARLSQAWKIVCESLLKSIRMRFKFESDYLNRTIFLEGDLGKLIRCSADDLFNQMLDTQTSDAKTSELLAMLKLLEENALTYPMALLEGYRAAVDDGARTFLQYTDSELIKHELGDNKLQLGPLAISWRRLPLFFQWKVWQTYRTRHHELGGEDRRVIEQRIFLRGFTRGYDARMSAGLERSEQG